MKAQRDLLFNSLPKHGWEIVEVEEFHGVPWVRDTVDESWIIKSIWRPIGFRAYVLFLVDPQTDPSKNRRKGEHVWAVRVSKELDDKVYGEDYEDFPIRKGHWKETLNDLFAQLAKFRQSGL